MIQILINNIPIQFGHYPSPEIKINSIEIITPPLHFGINVNKGEGVTIIFNGTIMTKNDVNKYEEK